MELDNIKKEWGKLEIKSTIDEEKLQRIIRKRGQGAYSSLMRWESFSFLGIIFCLLFAYALFLDGKLYITIYFLSGCVIGFIWQIYKIRFLRKIDMISMPVMKIIPKVIQYRQYILKEIYVGICWFIGWMCLLILSRDIPSIYSIIILALVGAVLIYLMVLFYKAIYFKKINKINESLNELKDFESEE